MFLVQYVQELLSPFYTVSNYIKWGKTSWSYRSQEKYSTKSILIQGNGNGNI